MRFFGAVRPVNTVRTVRTTDSAGVFELPAVLGIPGVRPVGHCPLKPSGEGGFGEELAGGTDGRTQRLGGEPGFALRQEKARGLLPCR